MTPACLWFLILAGGVFVFVLVLGASACLGGWEARRDREADRRHLQSLRTEQRRAQARKAS